MKYLILAALVLAFIGGLFIKHEKPEYLTITFKHSASREVPAKKTASRAGGNRIAKAPTLQPVQKPAAITLPEQEAIATQVKAAFIEDPERAVAIFRAESGLRPTAQGWNCYYYNASGARYSAACAPQDRARAWSVDCGVAQLNFPGTECPEEAFNPDWNIQQAKVKYEHRGWQPWSAFLNGHYLAFLKW